MATITEHLLSALKKLNPSKVRAIAGDEVREIAVPERRKRWSQVIEAITAGPWHRCELVNKRGEVLGYVDNTAPAGDMEDLADNKKRSEVEWVVNTIVRAQREALSYRDSEVRELLQAQGQVVRELAQGMRAISDLYREQVTAARDLGTLQASGKDDVLTQLLDAAPELIKVLPLLRTLLSGEQPTAPKNGVKAHG